MYYFEILSTFLFLMLIGAIFSPIFYGCFGMLLVFMLLSMFIVFFSLNFIWFLLAGVVIYTVGGIVKWWKWQKLLDVNEYLQQHPECRLNVGVACHKCGSDKLTSHGIIYHRSKWRFYVCSSCGSTLFRFKVL